MSGSTQTKRRNDTWGLRHKGRLRGQISRGDLMMTPSALARFLKARRNANQVGKLVTRRLISAA